MMMMMNLIRSPSSLSRAGRGSNTSALRSAIVFTPTTAVRYLNVHEYISMELMASHGIQTPECHVAETTQEVDHIFNTSFHRTGGTFCFWIVGEYACSLFFLFFDTNPHHHIYSF